MSLKLHCNENERQWLTAEIDGDETILNIFSGEMGVEVPVVLSREQTQQLIDHLPCKGSMQAHIDNQAARIAELEEEGEMAGKIMEEIITTIANGLKVDPESAFNPDACTEGMAIEAAQVAASLFEKLNINFDDESGEFTVSGSSLIDYQGE